MKVLISHFLLGDTAAITCKVEGNPIPTFKWMRGNKELLSTGRFKHLTESDGSITLLMQKAKPQDDGPYKLIVENEHGKDEAIIKLLVTDPNSQDFRTLLKHREYEQWGKKEEDTEDTELKPPEFIGRRMSIRPGGRQDQWVKELQDTRVTQLVDKQAVLACQFSTGKAKIKWFREKNEIFPVSILY